MPGSESGSRVRALSAATPDRSATPDIFALTAALLMMAYWEFPLTHYARNGDFGVIRVNWRGALEQVREQAAPNDLVLIDSGIVETA